MEILEIKNEIGKMSFRQKDNKSRGFGTDW